MGPCHRRSSGIEPTLVEPRAPTTPEDVLTVPEVAKYLRVSTKTVYALLKRGELRGFRVGRVLRLRRTVVEEFVARRSDPTATASPKGRADEDR